MLWFSHISRGFVSLKENVGYRSVIGSPLTSIALYFVDGTRCRHSAPAMDSY